MLPRDFKKHSKLLIIQKEETKIPWLNHLTGEKICMIYCMDNNKKVKLFISSPNFTLVVNFVPNLSLLSISSPNFTHAVNFVPNIFLLSISSLIFHILVNFILCSYFCQILTTKSMWLTIYNIKLIEKETQILT